MYSNMKGKSENPLKICYWQLASKSGFSFLSNSKLNLGMFVSIEYVQVKLVIWLHLSVFFIY